MAESLAKKRYKKSKYMSRIELGWKEHVAFPDWGIPKVVAKVDTGARSSALHVENIQEINDRELSFDVVIGRRNKLRRIPVTAPLVRMAMIRSSTGPLRKRMLVEAKIQVGGVEKMIEVSLVSRPHHVCRMLLGRTALADDFVVVPDETHLTPQSS